MPPDASDFPGGIPAIDITSLESWSALLRQSNSLSLSCELMHLANNEGSMKLTDDIYQSSNVELALGTTGKHVTVDY